MPDDTKGRQFSRRDRIAELCDMLDKERAELDAYRERADADIEALIKIACDAIDLLRDEGAEDEADGLLARVDAVRGR